MPLGVGIRISRFSLSLLSSQSIRYSADESSKDLAYRSAAEAEGNRSGTDFRYLDLQLAWRSFNSAFSGFNPSHSLAYNWLSNGASLQAEPGLNLHRSRRLLSWHQSKIANTGGVMSDRVMLERVEFS